MISQLTSNVTGRRGHINGRFQSNSTHRGGQQSKKAGSRHERDPWTPRPLPGSGYFGKRAVRRDAKLKEDTMQTPRRREEAA
eukprot:2967992-Pleurochrysis_carterae.AAC.1